MSANRYRLEDYIGVRFGRLVVIGEGYSVYESGNRKRKFLCVCDCGTEKLVDPYELIVRKKTQSCGCYQADWTKQSKRKTQEQFIEESKARYPGLFEYDKVVYTTNKDNVTITCAEHGDFQASPSNHLKGCGGCPVCKGSSISKALMKDTEWFVSKGREVYGDTYDYSKTEYTGSQEKLIIICKKHGEFSCTATDHVIGRGGCPQCSREEGSFGFNPYTPAYLYVLHIDGMPFSFTGYGITGNPKQRLSEHKKNLTEQGFVISCVEQLYCENGNIIFKLEQELKREFQCDSRTKGIRGFIRESCFAPFNEVLSFAKTTLEQLKENEHGN